MKILIFTNHFLPQIGGIEIFSFELAKNLQNCGHDVTLFCVGKKKHVNYKFQVVSLYVPPLFNSTITKKFINLYNSYFTVFFISIYFLAKHIFRPFDLIHAQFLYPTGYQATILKKLFNIPVIVTPHGSDIFVNESISYGLRLNKFINSKIQFCLKTADAVTYCNNKMYNELKKLNDNNNTLYYLPNGTNTFRIKNFELSIIQKKKLRYQNGIKDNEITFITISRESKIKGLDTLFKSIQLLSSMDFKAKFILVSNNILSTKDHITRLGLNDYVIVVNGNHVEVDNNNLPVFPSTRIISMLKISDCFIATDLISGFNLTTVEALAAGLPLICNDGVGSSEFIEKYNAGIIYKNNSVEQLTNAIITFSKIDFNRIELATNALLSSNSLDWTQITNQTLSIYNKLISQYK